MHAPFHALGREVLEGSQAITLAVIVILQYCWEALLALCLPC